MTAEQSTDLVDRVLARLVPTPADTVVVDVGGGSGTRAVPLARAGCRVLVVDASTDALASLARRASDAGVDERIDSLQADADQLDAVLGPGTADVVLYHQVVQNVDDPLGSLTSAVRVLREGGVLSIVAPGLLAAVLAAAWSGRADAAKALLRDGDPGRRFDAVTLRALMESAGLVVESIQGIGVLSSLSGDLARTGTAPDMVELEEDLGRHSVVGQMAGNLHGLGRKPAP